LTYLGEPEDSPQDGKTNENIENIVEQVQQYPTPRDTPERARLGGQDQDKEPSRPHHTPRNICTPDLADIIEGPQIRKPSRKQAYQAQLANLEEMPGYYTAFMASTYTKRESLHQDQLPVPPQSWNDLRTHVH